MTQLNAKDAALLSPHSMLCRVRRRPSFPDTGFDPYCFCGATIGVQCQIREAPESAGYSRRPSTEKTRLRFGWPYQQGARSRRAFLKQP